MRLCWKCCECHIVSYSVVISTLRQAVTTMGFFKKLRCWRKKNKRSDYKKRREEPESNVAELKVRLKEKDRVMEKALAMMRGTICEVEEMIAAATDSEMDSSQQTVRGYVDDVKPQVDLYANEHKGSAYKTRAEDTEKEIQELQDSLKEKDRVMLQLVAMFRGTMCEVDDMIAATGGVMDAKQQTVQVHVENIMQQKDLCASELGFESKENTRSDYMKRIEETEKVIEEIDDRLKEVERKKEKVLADIFGTIREEYDKIVASDSEVDGNQRTVEVHVENIKQQKDLSATELRIESKKNVGPDYKKRSEEIKKEIAEIKDNLKELGRQKEKLLDEIFGTNREDYDKIVASDSEVDGSQQTVEVHMEDIKPLEGLCARELGVSRKETKESNYKEHADETENTIEVVQDMLKETDGVMEQTESMIGGSVCQVDDMIAVRGGAVDTNKQTVQVDLEDTKPQTVLCALKFRFWRKRNKESEYKKRAVEAENKIVELQVRLKEEDRVIEQELAMNVGRICESDEVIAARGGAVDINQQTAQVYQEDIKPQEVLCAPKRRLWTKKNKKSDLKKRAEAAEKIVDELQNRLNEKVTVMKQTLANEKDSSQQSVNLHVEDFKPLFDLCIKELKKKKKKKNEKLQDNVEEEGRERKQE